MDEEIKRKYLREQIIEQGYDPNQFENFCEQQKGVDIDNYTWEELQDLVQSFKMQGNQIPSFAFPPKTMMEQFDNFASLNLYDDSLIPKILPQEQAEEQQSIMCQKLEDNAISKFSQVSIEISKPEKVLKQGFINSNYIVYYVITQELGWSVRRRYSDFLWLWQSLYKFFPQIYIPPIPPKGVKGNFSEKMLTKRRYFLQEFLQSVVRSPALRGSKQLLVFLSEESDNKFGQYKSQNKLQRSPIHPSDYRNETGVIYASFEDYVSKFNGISCYLQKSSALRKKISKLSSQTQQCLLDLSQNFYELSLHIKEYEELQSSIHWTQKSSGLFSNLHQALQDMSRFALRQDNYIRDHFYHFFSYRYKEVEHMKELMKLSQNHKLQYLKAYEKLSSRKEKLWIQKDFRTIQSSHSQDRLHQDKDFAISLLLPKESEQVKILKQVYGIYNYHWEDEIERKLLDEQLLDFINFEQFGIKVKGNLQVLEEQVSQYFENISNIRSSEIPNRHFVCIK